MRNPIVTVLFVLSAIYVVFLLMFIIEHPHAFDCTDQVICNEK